MYKILLIPIIIGFWRAIPKNYPLRPDAQRRLETIVFLRRNAFIAHSLCNFCHNDCLLVTRLKIASFYAVSGLRSSYYTRCGGFTPSPGQHGQIINRLRNLLPADERINIPPLEERMGHTPAEALAGAIWGIVGSIVLWSIM